MGSKKKRKRNPPAREGRIFFSYYAVGKGGRPVKIVKVRTLRRGSLGRSVNMPEGSEMRFGKYVNHPNLTRMGRFLRERHIDEIPQLPWVLAGRIRPVGMRPMTRRKLGGLPEDLREFYRGTGASWISAAYAAPTQPRTVKDVRRTYREYIAYKRKRPYLADWVYGTRALYNVFFRGYKGA